jgi:hypothetical protein
MAATENAVVYRNISVKPFQIRVIIFVLRLKIFKCDNH